MARPEINMGEALKNIRAIETLDRVDHSMHIDHDGNGCGHVLSWNTRMGRDIAAVLDKAGVAS